MPDTFICGDCNQCFFDIQLFVDHKKTPCGPAAGNLEGTSGETQVGLTTTPLPGGGQEQQGVIVHQEGEEITSVPITVNISGPGGTESIASSEKNVQNEGSVPQTPKRRGRRKKSEMPPSEPSKTVTIISKELAKPTLPEKGSDGKYHCTNCKKSFPKDRHFLSHKCLPTTDYVDISKKLAEHEDVDEEEENMEEEVEDDDDDDATVEYKERDTPVRKYRKRQPRDPDAATPAKKRKTFGDIKEETSDGTDAKEGGATGGSKKRSKTIPPRQREDIPDVCVFADEKEKEEFDAHIGQIDLSGIDHMFKIHHIDQDIDNTAAVPQANHRTPDNEICIFSCNVCNKVFKTLSHMRQHCLTHTLLKPYTCPVPDCDYKANAKGNLYTHMRKHTGQYYRCSCCPFKTVNKTHLLEHEGIHNDTQHECKICRRSYKTAKSLVNHVRKYHIRSKVGKDYIAQLAPKPRNDNSVLYMCHVCNRKFKKKVDRDRHLFTHNIKNNANVYECFFCDYIASRNSYLEQHMHRHRVIYKCALCQEQFLSTVRLNEHINHTHSPENESMGWEVLFEQCINSSLYFVEDQDKDLMEGTTLYADYQDISAVIAPGTETSESGSVDPSDILQPVKPDEENNATNASATDSEANDDATAPETTATDATPKEKAESSVADVIKLRRLRQLEVILKKLGYRIMNMEVFRRIRLTYGNEECEFCGKLFHSKNDYEPHVRTHTGDKPYGCDWPGCSYRAITKDNMKRHIEKEHQKLTFTCETCGFIANSRTQHWNHMQTHKETPVECPECKTVFPTKKKLRNHLNIKHPQMSNDVVKQLTSVTAKKYSKLGRKSNKCPYCDRIFSRGNTDLQKHIWIHEGLKPFKCHLCEYACRSKNNLQAHMLRHSSEKPFICTQCGKAYKSRTALRWHVRSHKNGKLFKCTRCAYEGTQKSHLVRHMETHEIIKKYGCEHCEYSANTIGYMKIHYTKFHKGIQFNLSGLESQKLSAPHAKVYKCLSCDYLFGNLYDLKRHLRVRHRIDVGDIAALDNAEVTRIVSADGGEQVQVVHVTDPFISSEEQDAGSALQSLQYSGVAQGDEMDEKTASAVNILQQIIDMSQQGAFGQQQQITVQTAGTEGLVAVNPETIIVQQEGEEIVVSTTGASGEQYAVPTTQYPAEGVEITDGTVIETVTPAVEIETTGIVQ